MNFSYKDYSEQLRIRSSAAFAGSVTLQFFDQYSDIKIKDGCEEGR